MTKEHPIQIQATLKVNGDGKVNCPKEARHQGPEYRGDSVRAGELFGVKCNFNKEA